MKETVENRWIRGDGLCRGACEPTMPGLTCSYFALQVKVYLHHNAAHWLAIGGNVEEHSWIRHCSRQNWSRVTSGEVMKVVARAEKGWTAADLLYITRPWAVKTS